MNLKFVYVANGCGYYDLCLVSTNKDVRLRLPFLRARAGYG
jgi:hypothetical protein